MAPAAPPPVSSVETSCTVLFHTERASAVQQEEIMRDLESPDIKVRSGCGRDDDDGGDGDDDGGGRRDRPSHRHRRSKHGVNWS